ncbi:hypothetical protein EPK99_06270 [Neorhizobium lilium]|uniref:Alpha/beta hydrolase n=1 Tax=Neorhizobium lilium TaxID=2503024 RepID=A0A444LGU3_9HYPH|nr:hypothetical protein [Neorhizobium lilium]RWX78238.1 hypothetical protein EPK99_06270 [Neorhizobium lilium]
MSGFFQDTTSHGIRLNYSQTPLSDINIGDLRSKIHELNLLSEQLGCVVFEGQKSNKTDLVIFAGNLERFSMLSAARDVSSRVFYFQDTASWWYGGSSLLPDIRGISAFLLEHVRNRNCLIFGQSSGGYAALVSGALIPHADVLACSPQTFSDSMLKRRLHVAPSIGVQYAPDYLLDIEALYAASNRTGIAAAIFAASEFQNPYRSHLWMDHLHLAKTLRVPSIESFLADAANHSIVFQRAGVFSECLKKLLSIGGKRAELKLAAIRKLVNGMRMEDVSSD